MSECDNCGYAGQDLAKYRELLQRAHDNARDERISELEQQLAELMEEKGE